jgi:LysR family glycine cleavage system transcriptional activator
LAQGRLATPFEDAMPSGDRLTILSPATRTPHPLRERVVEWLGDSG